MTPELQAWLDSQISSLSTYLTELATTHDMPTLRARYLAQAKAPLPPGNLCISNILTRLLNNSARAAYRLRCAEIYHAQGEISTSEDVMQQATQPLIESLREFGLVTTKYRPDNPWMTVAALTADDGELLLATKQRMEPLLAKIYEKFAELVVLQDLVEYQHVDSTGQEHTSLDGYLDRAAYLMNPHKTVNFKHLKNLRSLFYNIWSAFYGIGDIPDYEFLVNVHQDLRRKLDQQPNITALMSERDPAKHFVRPSAISSFDSWAKLFPAQIDKAFLNTAAWHALQKWQTSQTPALPDWAKQSSYVEALNSIYESESQPSRKVFYAKELAAASLTLHNFPDRVVSAADVHSALKLDRHLKDTPLYKEVVSNLSWGSWFKLKFLLFKDAVRRALSKIYLCDAHLSVVEALASITPASEPSATLGTDDPTTNVGAPSTSQTQQATARQPS